MAANGINKTEGLDHDVVRHVRAARQNGDIGLDDSLQPGAACRHEGRVIVIGFASAACQRLVKKNNLFRSATRSVISVLSTMCFIRNCCPSNFSNRSAPLVLRGMLLNGNRSRCLLAAPSSSAGTNAIVHFRSKLGSRPEAGTVECSIGMHHLAISRQKVLSGRRIGRAIRLCNLEEHAISLERSGA
jgi:hypothetical protein